MTDKKHIDAVSLPANSFDIQKLGAKLDHAAGLKTEAGKADAISKAVESERQMKGTIDLKAKPEDGDPVIDGEPIETPADGDEQPNTTPPAKR